MMRMYVHAEGSSTVNVLATAVVDVHVANVDSRIWVAVAQPEA
jgi:hypothetical protein